MATHVKPSNPVATTTTPTTTPPTNQDYLLFSLVCCRNWDAVRKMLVKATAKQLNIKASNDNVSILHAACISDAPLDVISTILKKGGSVHDVSDDGESCLYDAMGYGASSEVISLLLQAGADPNYATHNTKRTAMHAGCHFRLSRMGANPANIKLLLEHGAHANAQDISGITPLHFLFFPRDTEDHTNVLLIARLLLDHGADPSPPALTAHGSFLMKDDTPLHVGAMHGASLEMMMLILHYGANVFAKNVIGFTPLQVAQMQPRSKHLIPLLSNPPSSSRIKHGPKMIEDISCEYCGKSEDHDVHLGKCKGCAVARYCNMTCASAHWPMHKSVCFKIPMNVKVNVSNGCV